MKRNLSPAEEADFQRVQQLGQRFEALAQEMVAEGESLPLVLDAVFGAWFNMAIQVVDPAALSEWLSDNGAWITENAGGLRSALARSGTAGEA